MPARVTQAFGLIRNAITNHIVKIGAETECVRVGNILAAIGLVVTVVQS